MPVTLSFVSLYIHLCVALHCLGFLLKGTSPILRSVGEGSYFGTPGPKTRHLRTRSKVDQRDTTEVSTRKPSLLVH